LFWRVTFKIIGDFGIPTGGGIGSLGDSGDGTVRTITANENKMSDGHRERASLEAK
jgi:hypothetical protein